MSDGTAGEGRIVEAEGRRWLALQPWRAGTGHGLAYFLALEDGEPSPDDRRDRRALLEPECELDALTPAELDPLLAGASPLTWTECRLAGADGEAWLVQSSGPVWAEGEVAAGLTGLVFTRLTGPPERHVLSGAGVAERSDEELWERLERARRRGAGASGSGAPEAGRPGVEAGPGGQEAGGSSSSA